MKKATHEGTCQVCGKLQALPAGVLSKHGYDVEFHYFRGVCPGADHLPLELDRSFADEVAASLDRQSAATLKSAESVARGEQFPERARSGNRVKDTERGWGFKDEMVAYEDAPEYYQKAAVAALECNLRSQAKSEADAASGIRARADKITGKQALTERVEETRKELAAGSKFKLWGHVCTVVRIEDRVAKSVGPYLNGNVMPHAIYSRDGDDKLRAYPTRLIRQASIL